MSASILVVDDNEMNRDLLQRRLGKKGYDVIAVEDGYTALEMVAGGSFELVILDVLMPGMSGLDVLRALRADFSPAALPIIMATARSETEEMVEAMSLGATDYVTKPINLPMLLARIEAQLSMRRRSTRRESLSLGKLGPGSVLDGRYELGEEIGRGGFSVVYRATQVSTGQGVAIKIIRPELVEDSTQSRGEIERERFVLEMKIIGSLSHPHIVQLIDTGVLAEGHLYTVLEHVDGRTLHDVIQAEGPLRPADTKRLLLQVLDALSCAHGKGVIHLDLKPQNIMVIDSGARRNGTVLDFGLAEVCRQGEFLPSLVRGTPAYMAPEHLRKQPVTPRSDLYAWGLILVECLTGDVAIQRGTRGAVVLEHLSPRAVKIPDEIVDPGLRALIERAVAKDPADRLASAEEAIAALEALDLNDSSVLSTRWTHTDPGATTSPAVEEPESDPNATQTLGFLD